MWRESNLASARGGWRLKSEQEKQPRGCVAMIFFLMFIFIYLAVLGLSGQKVFGRSSPNVGSSVFSCGMRILTCSMWDLAP